MLKLLVERYVSLRQSLLHYNDYGLNGTPRAAELSILNLIIFSEREKRHTMEHKGQMTAFPCLA